MVRLGVPLVDPLAVIAEGWRDGLGPCRSTEHRLMLVITIAGVPVPAIGGTHGAPDVEASGGDVGTALGQDECSDSPRCRPALSS
jgi:hypothetical protein